MYIPRRASRRQVLVNKLHTVRLGEQGGDRLQLEDELQCVLPGGHGDGTVLAWPARQGEAEEMRRTVCDPREGCMKTSCIACLWSSRYQSELVADSSPLSITSSLLVLLCAKKVQDTPLSSTTLPRGRQ